MDMNSLQAHYAQIKMKKLEKNNKNQEVIIQMSTKLPNSEVLRSTMIDSYRSYSTLSSGKRRRPLVPLVIG